MKWQGGQVLERKKKNDAMQRGPRRLHFQREGNR
jgi:hypothetical protein